MSMCCPISEMRGCVFNDSLVIFARVPREMVGSIVEFRVALARSVYNQRY
jgi:hypothetical protein